jgi:hypothetical protein
MKIVFLVSLLALLALLLACTRRVPPRDPIAGGLYAVNAEHGKRGVAKVLVVDQAAIHVRLYRETFDLVPKTITESQLSLGSIHDPGTPGIGHLPLSRAAFFRLDPIFVRQSTVTAEELEGYKYWKDSGGQGVWP